MEWRSTGACPLQRIVDDAWFIGDRLDIQNLGHGEGRCGVNGGGGEGADHARSQSTGLPRSGFEQVSLYL